MDCSNQEMIVKGVLSSDVSQIGNLREMIASDGTMISWVDFGSGKPLIISPALGTPLASWLPAIRELSVAFRVIFVLTRGGYEGPIPQNLGELTVERRGDDLVELINALELPQYFMVAHSSGVSPVVVSLKKLSKQPSHVCLISARYDAGPSVDANALIRRARNNPGFFSIVQSVVLGFSPPSLAELIRKQLSDFSRLEALLRAFEYSRAFNCFEGLNPSAPITFVIAEFDPEDVRNTTSRVVGTQSKGAWSLVDVKEVGHFFVQSDGVAAAKLVSEILVSL